MTESIRFLPGVGQKRAELFAVLGIETIGDLLYHFPRAYQDRGSVIPLSEAVEGQAAAFLLTVATEPRTSVLKGRMTLTKFTAFDESGRATVSFFNNRYAGDSFHVGETFRFWGRPKRFNGAVELSSPDYEPAPENVALRPLVPIYPLTAGLTQKIVSAAIGRALDYLDRHPPVDPLPAELLRERGLLPLADALRAVHAPSAQEDVENARKRFVFEELFLFALGSRLRRGTVRRSHAPVLSASTRFCGELLPFFTRQLPYAPTGAQARVMGEILADLTDPEGRPMERILSGDVGSGKTLIAAFAAFVAGENGYQAALMVPTSILARQHYDDLSPLFEKLGLRAALLIGALKPSEKAAIHEQIASGDVDFVIGTHALLSEGVRFSRLGLVITDEQHRFGIAQRNLLGEKGSVGKDAPVPHTLVMSATPIPRTLAMALYGDLSHSCLDELPPGRQKVDTFVVGESYRERLNGFIRKNVLEGHQVYVVVPAVEPPEDDPVDGDVILFDFSYDAEAVLADSQPPKNAVDWTRTLKEEFPDLSVGMVHGKMKDAEKDAVMRDFAANRIHILVATTVIEVGVNVPNAVLMIVENADRFGLSQLHQLRGRVGRGSAKSWCVLVSDTRSEASRMRLNAMRATNDGYRIAEYDLEQRGPGDFLPMPGGEVRQHGAPQLRLASLVADMPTLQDAFSAADIVLAADPALTAHPVLLDALRRMFD